MSRLAIIRITGSMMVGAAEMFALDNERFRDMLVGLSGITPKGQATSALENSFRYGLLYAAYNLTLAFFL